jgi:hypothetical protein
VTQLGNDINNMSNEDINSNQHESTVSPLGAMELEACRLKFEGYNAKEISAKLTVEFGERAPAWQTVRTWFMKGGKLYDWYKSYTTDEAKARQDETLEMYRAHLKNAMREVIRLMNQSTADSVRLQAACKIIDRQLGEIPKTIQIGKDPATRILEELCIIGDDEDNESKENT